MRPLLLCLLTLFPLGAQQKGRVFLISLDGMGYQSFSEDPASSELKALKRLAGDGIYAPMQTAFPSLTAPGHASIFTGVYGNVNGITANTIPTSFTEHANGFRSDQLRSEMFWVQAGRAGVKSVAHNTTQGFPCNQFNSGPNVTLMNGYQTAEVAPEKLVHASDVTWLDMAPEGFIIPEKSRQLIHYFRYSSGRIQFAGAVFAKSLRYDTLRMTAYSGKRYVDATLRDGEIEPVRQASKTRPLARYFSEALPVANLTAVHFRLFELSADGKEFMLYQTQGKEISVCADGETQAIKFKERLLNSAGAFIGNGAGKFYETGQFGKRNADGLAERRWMETLELHARQSMRHTRALLDEFGPRLIVDYISTADDLLHMWKPEAALGDRFTEPYRRWGYQIVDWRIEEIRLLLKEQDHFVIVSDHGMTVATHEIRLNTILKDLGYADRVIAGAQFFRLKDRTDKALLEELKQKLSDIRDGNTKVFSEWFWPSESAAKFGIGGENGGDLYFDLSPGFTISFAAKLPAIAKLETPHGVHGLLPTRSDMLALFIAYGPDLHSRPVTMRSVDVAPLVLRLLGI